MIKYIPNALEDSLWVKVKKEETSEDKDIYIGTVYLSPANNIDKAKRLESFFKEAKSFKEKGIVIIQGDMNARTNSLPDYIERDKSDDMFGISNQEKPLPRNSEDRKTCP